MARIEPEMIPVRIEEYKDRHGNLGFQTKSGACVPVNIIYYKREHDNKYSFLAWEAGVGHYQTTSDEPITTEEKARIFSESKLRTMIRER